VKSDAPNNLLVLALQKIVEFLESREISYMIIGGIANSIYGYPRQTFDIDVKIALKEDSLSALIHDLVLLGEMAVEDPLGFVSETNVIPIDIDKVRVDIILAALPYEKEAIKRSQKENIYGVEAHVVTVEDLIIQKCISIREKDWMDISEIIKEQREILDWPYLMKHVEDLSQFLSDPTIIKRIYHFKDEK